MLHILQEGELLRARDHREPNHFWADKEVVEDYLPKIGANAFAVYMLLSYYARSSTGRCYPSINTMVSKLGLSKQTVRKALNTLATEKLIHITKSETTSKDGKPMNAPYTYTILNVKRNDDQGVGKSVTQGGQDEYPGVGKSVTPNNIYINNTKEQDSISNATLVASNSETQFAFSPAELYLHNTDSRAVWMTPVKQTDPIPVGWNTILGIILNDNPDYAGYTRLKEFPEAPSKVPQKVSPTPQPHSDANQLPKITDAEKNALAVVCYGTVDAWKDKRYASAMMQSLKRIKAFTPGMNQTTIEAFGRDWNKNDFRGQKAQRAKPHQVADEWLTFKERCKTDPACNGQGGEMQTEYVRIPHPDPNLAAHGIMKTIHRSELEAKKK